MGKIKAFREKIKKKEGSGKNKVKFLDKTICIKLAQCRFIVLR